MKNRLFNWFVKLSQKPAVAQPETKVNPSAAPESTTVPCSEQSSVPTSTAGADCGTASQSVQNTTSVRILDQKSNPARKRKPAFNAIVLDEVEGKLFEYIDDSQYIFEQIGRRRRYRKNLYQTEMVYFVKRSRAGSITPVKPPELPGEITPEQAGDALHDPHSGPVFAAPTTWLDVLKDFKYPIIIGLLIAAIFFLAFSFNNNEVQSIPIPGITQ